MKKIIAAAAICLLAAPSAFPQSAKMDLDPTGTVSYALPQTSLVIDAVAVKESFHAGPYAQFAQKYLGIEAKQSDIETYRLSSVKITPCIEADQNSRYTVSLAKGATLPAYLQFTAQGLIASPDGGFSGDVVWRFPADKESDFSLKGVTSNFSKESATLYRSSGETAYGRVSVQQSMVVEKSLEKKAQEASEMIFNLRRTRVQVVTGDTDASYSGEAMQAVLSELDRLEKEYMTLFVGYSDFETQEQRFDIVPENGPDGNVCVAFRLSDRAGLLPSGKVEGKPYLLEINAREIASTSDAKATHKSTDLMYRIPAICTVTLSDGASIILQTRIPIYQYGLDKSYPIL